MKCTQKAEKKLFLEGDLFMDGGKRASVRNIVISVLLIVVGIAMLMLVTEGIKSGWYDAHSARPAKRKGYAALLPVLLVLLGGFNLYRGLRGKAFQMDISSMFSGHKDGSPSACPHCGAQLQPVEALLAMRPDAVAIETAEEQAASIAQRCADLGIAVYLDKPGAMTCAEFDRVADTLEQKHLPLQLG